MINQNATIRRAIAAVTGFVLVIVAGISLNYYILQPRLVLTAPVGSIVTVQNIDDGQSVTQTTTDSDTTLHVGVGSYSLKVATASRQQLFYANTSLLQIYSFALDAPRELAAHYTTKAVAYDATRQDSNLVYLDTTNRALVSVSDQGVTTKLIQQDTSQSSSGAQGLYPIANNQAVVLADSKLWILHDSQLTPLDTTGFPDSLTSIIVASNPAQQSFVVAANQIIYWYSAPDAVPQKVMTFPKRFDQLVYGGHTLIAYSTRMPQATEDIRSAYSAYAVDPLVADITTKIQRTLSGGPIVDATVSPDGAYATISPQGTMPMLLYRMSDRTVVARLETADAGPWWFTAGAYVYAKDSTLWRYDVANHVATALGTVPSSLSPTSLTYDTFAARYYATTFDDASHTAIYSLSAGAANHNAEQAARLSVSNQVHNQFQLSYINLSQPTVVINTSVVSNNPTASQFKTLTFASRQAALDYLQRSGIDASALTIIYKPSL